jgi:protein-disulfide isomerase
VTLGVLLGVGGLLWQFGGSTDKPIADVAGNMAHTEGAGAVTLVEFSDFQCPACSAVQPMLTQLLTKYQGKVKFVYRYFPLVSIHKNAQMSAQAAEAAGLQGKFWEMHDKLFITQTAWEGIADPKEIFVGYARDLGLDTTKFATDLVSAPVVDEVNADSAAATRYNLQGTPTFFVNGVNTDFAQIDGKIAGLVK